MLLDQKRTKRVVQIVSVFAAIAFAGGGVLAIIFIFLGGGSTAAGTDQFVKDALVRVETSPRDADAWIELAGAYDRDLKPDLAADAAARAVKLEPGDFSYVQQLVGLQERAGRLEGAVTALQAYTQRKPKDPQGFQLLGNYASDAGKPVLARFAYTRFLDLDPDNLIAPQIREQLKQLQAGSAVTPAP